MYDLQLALLAKRGEYLDDMNATPEETLPLAAAWLKGAADILGAVMGAVKETPATAEEIAALVGDAGVAIRDLAQLESDRIEAQLDIAQARVTFLTEAQARALGLAI